MCLDVVTYSIDLFQHTAARRRLASYCLRRPRQIRRFNTQPPEGGWDGERCFFLNGDVSTHSRPKAAGRLGNLS